MLQQPDTILREFLKQLNFELKKGTVRPLRLTNLRPLRLTNQPATGDFQKKSLP